MELLSRAERELLEWLEKQDAPVFVDQLMTAPSYDPERSRSLVERKLIAPVIVSLSVTAYKITDKGRAALEALQQHDQQEARQEAERKQDRKDHLRFALIGALAAFGLEHLDELFHAVRTALHHLFKISCRFLGVLRPKPLKRGCAAILGLALTNEPCIECRQIGNALVGHANSLMFVHVSSPFARLKSRFNLVRLS